MFWLLLQLLMPTSRFYSLRILSSIVKVVLSLALMYNIIVLINIFILLLELIMKNVHVTYAKDASIDKK